MLEVTQLSLGSCELCEDRNTKAMSVDLLQSAAKPETRNHHTSEWP